MTRHLIALGGACAILIALPWLLVSREPPASAPPPWIDDRPLRPAPAVAIDAVLDRDPFGLAHADPVTDDPSGNGPSGNGAEELGDGPPRIVGIVGRLPDRAVVLVRRHGGGTRPLALGESFGRWRLESIVADAALFGDGTRRVRVELPAADPAQ